MVVELTLKSKKVRLDVSRPIDLSLKIRREENVNAYYIEAPSFEPVRIGSFVGSVPLGGACNCEDIKFNAHGNGTHTECVGHISQEFNSVMDVDIPHFQLAYLLTVHPEKKDEDLIVPHRTLDNLPKDIDALIVRTLPNKGEKRAHKYSGTNPVYFDPSFTARVAEMGIKHLLVDTPSVDREEDGGKLLAHRAFWNYPDNTRKDACITELIFADNSIADGHYVLHLQVSPFDSDAAPSTPLLFPILHA
jgi:arylformamidase